MTKIQEFCGQNRGFTPFPSGQIILLTLRLKGSQRVQSRKLLGIQQWLRFLAGGTPLQWTALMRRRAVSLTRIYI